MTKFKVGDRVRVIKSPYLSVPLGTEGVVAYIEHNRNAWGFDMITMIGPSYSAFWEYEIERVEEEQDVVGKEEGTQSTTQDG